MVKMPFEKKPSMPPVDINKLIDKGAPVKDDIKDDNSKKWTNINLRIPQEMINEIDQSVENTIGITRTGWILQTIQKELKRLSSDSEKEKEE